jgi:hypothetical protein
MCATFWSDTSLHFEAQPLVLVSPGDKLSADLTFEPH